MKLGVCSLLSDTTQDSWMSFLTSKTTKSGFIDFCTDNSGITQFRASGYRIWYIRSSPKFVASTGSVSSPLQTFLVDLRGGTAEPGCQNQFCMFFVQIFGESPWRNPRWPTNYALWRTSPDSSESRVPHLCVFFIRMRID